MTTTTVPPRETTTGNSSSKSVARKHLAHTRRVQIAPRCRRVAARRTTTGTRSSRSRGERSPIIITTRDGAAVAAVADRSHLVRHPEPVLHTGSISRMGSTIKELIRGDGSQTVSRWRGISVLRKRNNRKMQQLREREKW